MSTSDRTINQVRAILNKLDRSIDEAREKRTHVPPPAPPVPLVAPVQAAPTPAPSPSTSQYGRAQPMPKAQPANMLRWKS